MRERQPHWAWIILAVCFLDVYVNFSIQLGYGVILPEMIRALGLNRTQGGAIFNCYILVYVSVAPMAGNLLDRWGGRLVISVFCIALGLGALLMGTTTSFVHAGVAFAVIGVGSAAMWSPTVALVQLWFGPRRRGLALGIISMGAGLGLALGGWLFPLVIRAASWRWCWYLLGGQALVMVGLNWLLLRDRPQDIGLQPWGGGQLPPVDEGGAAPRPAYAEVLRHRRFWVIGFSYLFAAFALYMVTTFMVDYAREELGFPLESASFLATIHGMGQMLGLLIIPALSDKFGRRLTLAAVNVMVSLSVLSILAAGTSLSGLYLGVGSFGVFYGVVFPLYGACGGDYFAPEVLGTVVGAWTPFFGIGAMAAHFAGGIVRDLSGSYHYPFLSAILAALLAAALLCRLPRSVASA